jgi:hypothetical protein
MASEVGIQLSRNFLAFFLMFTPSNPYFRVLQASPRWPELLTLMNLPTSAGPE